jgi:CelD/BcsL family acetyltransferase involved in cellulose biosynthesis
MYQLKKQILRSLAEVQTIAPEWADLWQRCQISTAFQRPEWLLPWIEVFSPEQIVATEVRHDSKLVGFAPLLIYARGAERVLAFMGGGVSDYLDLLADQQFETGVVESLLEIIHQEIGWATLDLTDLPKSSVLLRGSLGESASEHDSCSVLTLPCATDALLHLFSKRQRANLRNARSRLQKIGESQVEIATAETLPDFLEDLFRLHTARWSQAGQPGVLHDEAVKAFHRLSAPRLLRSGVLRLYRSRLGSRTLAVTYALFERQTVFCYLQGFDPEFAFFSPGTQLMFSVMEDAMRAGIDKFDFLRGDESYKQHWRAQDQPTYRIQLQRSALFSESPTRTKAA